MIVLVLGVTAYRQMNVRMMPDVEIPYVLVMTAYEGAGAQEIEQQVSKPVEDSLSGIAGIKNIMSISQDNMSIVVCEFELDVNVEVAAQEVRDKMSTTVAELPDDITTPMIMKMDMNAMPLVGFSLKANMSPEDIYDFADTVLSNEIAQTDGVSQVRIIGGTEREIHVNVDKQKLRDYRLTLTALAGKIALNNLNIPSGTVDRGLSEMTYRTIGEFESIPEIQEVTVNFTGNDVPVRIGDIATVEEARKKVASIGRLVERDGDKIISEPTLMVMAFKQSKSNDVKISDNLLKKMDDLNKKYAAYPGSPQLALIFDGADPVRKNVADVVSTILEGILLAVIVVYFFLGSWRSTFITALALPNSLIGAFLLMYVFNFSINVFSLMSLSLAVGLLIDDAIVVRENIFRHYEKGKNPVLAAIDGTNEVTFAVIATTAAVIAVFTPVAFLSGMVGQFFKEFGLTVVFAMIISILDALTIAPMLSAYIIPTHEKAAADAQKTGLVRNTVGAIAKVIRALTVGWFEKVFGAVLRFYQSIIKRIVVSNTWRIGVISCSVLLLAATLFVATKFVDVSFMPNSESGEFSIDIKADPSASIEQMDIYAKEIEDIIMSNSSVEKISSQVGGASIFGGASNEASLTVTMLPANQRTISTAVMRDKIRRDLIEKYGDKLDFGIKAQSGMGSSSAIEINIKGADGNIDVLYEVAQTLMARYKEIPHFVDIQSNFTLGKPETQIHIDKMKMEMTGVNAVDAGKEIRAMIDGALAGKFREHGNEYDIRVQLPDSQKDIISDIDNTYVYNANGRQIRVSKIAKIVEGLGPTAIYRRNKERIISVEGNLEQGGLVGPVQAEAIRIFNEEKNKPENLEKWKDIDLVLSGDAESMQEMQQAVIVAMGMALLFIFLVLASLYESIITPFTIMTALPFAMIGGIVALIITGQALDVFTMIGLVMLLGIVAKNSILLIDYAQQKIRGGMEISEALVKAGETRLRPILMTSFALIAGMLPTALGLTEVGQFRKGMGIVVIGGIISSTLLTLLVVPSIFEYLDTFRHFIRRHLPVSEKRMVDHTDDELKNMKL
jgi:HAE1 family hydrophobic/amphiphilic exporter-1